MKYVVICVFDADGYDIDAGCSRGGYVGVGGDGGGGHGADVVDVAAVVVLSGQPGKHVAVHPLQPSPKQSLDQRPEEADRGSPSSSS